MAIDRSKGVQWMAAQPNMVVSIFTKGASPIDPPILIYNGIFGEAMVAALKDFNIIYNYDPDATLPLEDSGLLYSTDLEETALLILAADAELDASDIIIQPGYTVNGISIRDTMLDNVIETFKIITTATPEGDVISFEPAPLNMGSCDGFDCVLTNALIAGVDSDIILISGTQTADLGAILKVPETAEVTLTGPNGAITPGEVGSLNICLAPIQPITDDSGLRETSCFELDGLVAIEINGEIVPYHFAAEDLPKFFNASNSYGIQFEKCGEIQCVPSNILISSNNLLGRAFTTGEWSIDYSINNGPTQTYTVLLEAEQWAMGVWRSMMEAILGTPDSNIQWVGGGGGVGHFQLYNWSLLGGGMEGGADSRTISLIRNTNHVNDLYWFFLDYFNNSTNGERTEAISCGTSEFPGY